MSEISNQVALTKMSLWSPLDVETLIEFQMMTIFRKVSGGRVGWRVQWLNILKFLPGNQCFQIGQARTKFWDLLGFILFVTINAVPIKPRHFNCRDTIWWDKSGRFGAWWEFLVLRNHIFSRRDLAPPQTLPNRRGLGCLSPLGYSDRVLSRGRWLNIHFSGKWHFPRF